MYNKKVLKIATDSLNKAKAPAKPLDKFFSKPLISDKGYKAGPPPTGSHYRIPGNENGTSIYNPTPYPLNLVGPNGTNTKIDAWDTNTQNFDEPYIDEFELKRGGALKSKKYSKSMSATNKLLAKNKLFESKKSKIFDPNANFKTGGETKVLDLSPKEIAEYVSRGYIVEDIPQQKEGGEPGDRLSKRILKRYPGMQKVYGKEGENLNIIKDPNYTASDYGFGDIEFIEPGSGHVQYSDDYGYQSPTPDKYTAVYNPKGANRHDVFLDTMHGMRNDPEYMKLLDTFSAETRKARGKSMDHWYEVDSQQDPYLVADGREKWDDNFIDGVLRSHLAKKGMGRHSSDVKGYKMERQDSTPEMYKATDDIYKYLKGKYEQGGYIETKLSPEEIQEYAKGGYIIEDISVPELDKAQKGKTVKPYYTSDREDYDYHMQMKADSADAYNQYKNYAIEYPRIWGPEANWRGDGTKIGNKAKIITNVVPFKGLTKEQQQQQLRAKQGRQADAEFEKSIDGRPHINEPIAYSRSIVGKPVRKVSHIFGPPTYEGWQQNDMAFPIFAQPVQEVIFRANNNTIKKTLTPVPTKVKYANKKKTITNSNVVPEDEVIPQDKEYKITNSDVVPKGYERVGRIFNAKLDPKTGKITEKEEFIYSPLPTRLNSISFPEVTRPEQEIIPAAPYKKPIRYSGPRYGVLAGDENLNLPEGYTQEQREAARRNKSATDFQQKNLEYQQQEKAKITKRLKPVGLTENFKEGGSSEQKIIFSPEEGGCPVGQYWTGTECKIIPKNTKIVYSQDELNKSNVSKKEQQKLYNQYISRINNHAAIDAGREKVYGNKGSKDKYYKTFESIPKSGFDPMMSYGTGQLIPNGLAIGVPALNESMVNFSTWKKMMDKSSIKPIGFKGNPGGGHFYPVYEKPSNYLLGYNKENVTTNTDIVPEDEVTPLKNIPYQQSIRPEYEIIPATPYVKPVYYAGPRHGTWSDGSKGQFPEGLNTSDWERKTKEYQQQQRGTKPIVTRKYGGILDKAQGGKTVYSGPKFGLVGPSTPKNNGSPLLPKQDLIKKYQQEVDKAKAIKIAEAERVRQKAIAKQKAINDAIPRGPVSDNTRTVIPNQAISDINNAAFYKSPQETANREARKKEQAAFEKEQWNKYNKMSFAEKALDRTQAAIAHPFLMAGNALAGNQGYIPGMGRGLMNTESPEYDKYLKATGQTKGQFEVSDLANIVNPGHWGGHAGNELHKGNYGTGLLEAGLAFAGVPGSGRTAVQGVKSLAQDINQGGKYLGSKIDKTIYPTRTYRAHLPSGNETSYEVSELAKKINKKGDWTTKNLVEAQHYLKGSESYFNKKGLLTGDDMLLTEYKVPFWKRNITHDKDVVALKKLQNVDINSNEFIIPNNKFLYPRRTNLIKAVPEEVKTFEQLSPDGDMAQLYWPGSVPMHANSTVHASKTYKYIEDQINAVTGHNMPLSYKFDGIIGNGKVNAPLVDWKQPRFAPNAGIGKFNDKTLPNSANVDFSKYLTQEEAVAARAERMISQEGKWVDQPSTLKGKFETAVENHNPASNFDPAKIGNNTGNSTQISKLVNLSDANKSRVAAHETGHYYRPTIKEGDEWNSFFDWSKLKGKNATSTSRDIRKDKKYLSGKGYYKRNSSQYGDEIRERAAQLKDYIAQKNGIPLNQNFEITQAQLDDAIANYVKDTGLDNNMSQMLGALTDKKGFLGAMNKYALGTIPAVIGAQTLSEEETPLKPAILNPGFKYGGILHKTQTGEEFDESNYDYDYDHYLQDAAKRNAPNAEGLVSNNTYLPEVIVRPENIPDWLKYKMEFDKSHPYDQYLGQEHENYKKRVNRKFANALGVDPNTLPEDREEEIKNDYEILRNNFITESLGKQKGYDPNKHKEWVDHLSNKEREIISYSDYGKNLQPSLWARTLAGSQELINAGVKATGIPGLLYGDPDKDVLNYRTSGLTNKEWNEIHNSGTGALETFYGLDAIGAAIANKLKNSRREQPGLLSGQLMGNVTPGDAAGLNPFLLTGIGEMAGGKSLLSLTADALRPGEKTTKIIKGLGKLGRDVITPNYIKKQQALVEPLLQEAEQLMYYANDVQKEISVLQQDMYTKIRKLNNLQDNKNITTATKQEITQLTDNINELEGLIVDKRLRLKNNEVLYQTVPAYEQLGTMKTKIDLSDDTSELINFRTGERVPIEIETPSVKTKIALEEGKPAKQQISAGDYSFNEAYANTQNENIDFVKEVLPGSKPYGSSVFHNIGVAHASNDIDVAMTIEDWNKIKNNVQISTEKQAKYGPTINLGKDFGKQGDIDVNIIQQNAETGMAEGDFATELYRQFFPDEFYKQTQDIIASNINNVYATKLPNLTINKTAKELMDVYDPEIKSILDAYEAGPNFKNGYAATKDKQINRIDYILENTTDFEKVKKAQELYIKSVVGNKGKIGYQFPIEKLSNVEDNIKLLSKMGIDPRMTAHNVNKIASEPKRMQLFLNDFYINKAAYTRQIELQPTTIKSIDNVISAYNDWQAHGESMMGMGTNAVEIGSPDFAKRFNDITGNVYYDLIKNKTYSEPKDYVDDLLKQTSGARILTGDEKDVLLNLSDKYNVRFHEDRIPTTLGDLLDAKNYSPISKNAYTGSSFPENFVKNINDFYKEAGKALGAKVIQRNTYGSSNYATLLNDFDKEFDALTLSFNKYVPELKSQQSRFQNLKTVAQGDADKLLAKDYYALKYYLDGGLEELKKQKRELAEFDRAFAEKIKSRAIKYGKNKEALAQLEKQRFDVQKRMNDNSGLRKEIEGRVRLVKEVREQLKVIGAIGVLGTGIVLAVKDEKKVFKENEKRNKEAKAKWLRDQEENKKKSDASTKALEKQILWYKQQKERYDKLNKFIH